MKRVHCLSFFSLLRSEGFWHSFARGLGCVGDAFSPHMPAPRVRWQPVPQRQQGSLGQDWKAVGDDLRYAMDKVANG